MGNAVICLRPEEEGRKKRKHRGRKNKTKRRTLYEEFRAWLEAKKSSQKMLYAGKGEKEEAIRSNAHLNEELRLEDYNGEEEEFPVDAEIFQRIHTPYSDQSRGSSEYNRKLASPVLPPDGLIDAAAIRGVVAEHLQSGDGCVPCGDADVDSSVLAVLEDLLANVDEIILEHERRKAQGDNWSPISGYTDDIENARQTPSPDEGKGSPSHDKERLTASPDEDRWTPPTVEGDIYRGAGILKKHENVNGNHGRNITWAADVKLPAADGVVVDPLLEAFMKERSRLVLMRTEEERRRVRMQRRMARRVKNDEDDSDDEIETDSPLPSPTDSTSHIAECMKMTQTSMAEDTRTLAKIAKTVSSETQKGPDRGISWPNKLENLCSVSSKAYYIEQFQRTELFRQRYRNKMARIASWERGLTSFQKWVVEHTGTAEIERILRPATKVHTNKARARVECWRKP